MSKEDENLDDTKRVMGELGRMLPKSHAEMKIGKIKSTAARSLSKKRGRPAASAKPKPFSDMFPVCGLSESAGMSGACPRHPREPSPSVPYQ